MRKMRKAQVALCPSSGTCFAPKYWTWKSNSNYKVSFLSEHFQDCKKCAPLVKKDCEICMKKFPKEDSSECVKKALAKEGKKECMECAKCEKPKLPFTPVQVNVISKTIDQEIKL